MIRRLFGFYNSDVKLICKIDIEILLVLVYSKSIIRDEQHYQNR
jgi:hypothetical protein